MRVSEIADELLALKTKLNDVLILINITVSISHTTLLSVFA